MEHIKKRETRALMALGSCIAASTLLKPRQFSSMLDFDQYAVLNPGELLC